MAHQEIKIEKNNYNMIRPKVSISMYAGTDLDNAKDVKKDLDDFYDYINQKYNQSDANGNNNSIFDTFLDYLKSLI